MSEMIKKLTPGHYNRFGWNDGDLQPVVTAEQRSRFGWLGGDLVPSNPMEEVHKSDVAIPQIGWLAKSPVDFYPQGLVVDGDWEIVKESDPFHVFGNVHEAHAFGMKHTLPWLAKLSHREKNELSLNRTDEQNTYMNSALRGLRPAGGGARMSMQEAASHRDVLSGAIHKAPPIAHGIVVHRGVEFTRTFNPHKELREGSTWHDPGIISTALIRNARNEGDFEYPRDEGTHVEIHVPKGTPGAYVEHPDLKGRRGTVHDSDYTEMLLDHHTHFHVLKNDPKNRHIVMQVVPKS